MHLLLHPFGMTVNLYSALRICIQKIKLVHELVKFLSTLYLPSFLAKHAENPHKII